MDWTEDYSIFKYKKGNRPVKQHKIRSLINSMKKNGFFEDYHLIVNQNMEIVDGQHRLEAAKHLRLPVPYEIAKQDYDIEQVITINESQDKWTIQDFLDGREELNNDNFLRFNEDVKKHELCASSIMLIVKGHTQLHKIKDGSLRWIKEDSEYLDMFMAELENFREVPFYKHHRFIKAYSVIRKKPSFKAEKHLKQGKRHSHKIHRKGGFWVHCMSIMQACNYGLPKEEHILLDQADFEKMSQS